MYKISNIVCLLLVVSAVLWAVACASSPDAENKENTTGSVITINAIKDNPDGYDGRTVLLTGRFKGWKGACKEAPPRTRSDWIMADDTGCIYVTGSIPKGLSPMSPNDETVTLTGVVRLTDSGVPYLEAQRP